MISVSVSQELVNANTSADRMAARLLNCSVLLLIFSLYCKDDEPAADGWLRYLAGQQLLPTRYECGAPGADICACMIHDPGSKH